MLIAFILSLHLLLISIYGGLIERKVSRLQCEHLLWALCLPFVGELCLLVAETGFFQATRIYKSPLIVEENGVTSGDHQIMVYKESQTITREYLLEVIKKRPSNLIELLKEALGSNDVEVAHIAAANIMRIQRGYETEIKLSEREYQLMKDDMSLLKNYIKSIDNYLSSNLLEGDLRVQMLETERSLLEAYITKMSGDHEVSALLQEVMKQLARKPDR